MVHVEEVAVVELEVGEILRHVYHRVSVHDDVRVVHHHRALLTTLAAIDRPLGAIDVHRGVVDGQLRVVFVDEDAHAASGCHLERTAAREGGIAVERDALFVGDKRVGTDELHDESRHMVVDESGVALHPDVVESQDFAFRIVGGRPARESAEGDVVFVGIRHQRAHKEVVAVAGPDGDVALCGLAMPVDDAAQPRPELSEQRLLEVAVVEVHLRQVVHRRHT